MGPHNTSDDPTRYVDPVELDEHRAFDPVERVRRYLTAEGLVDETSEQAVVQELRAEVDAAFAEAEGSRRPAPRRSSTTSTREPPGRLAPARGGAGARAARGGRLMAEMTMIEAIRSTLGDALEGDERVIVLGQDVGVNGGVFRATEGLQERFGAERVVDMPLAEAVIVGSAVGLACSGMIPIAELQFLGFGSQAFHQIEGQVARYATARRALPDADGHPRAVRRQRAHARAALRRPRGQVRQCPGLKVVMPATAHDAKGMLAEAIRDDDPVLFCEPLRGYRLIKDEVPDGDYTVPLGKARVVREGVRPRHRRLERGGEHRRASRRHAPPRRATRSACSTCAASSRWTSTRCARRCRARARGSSLHEGRSPRASAAEVVATIQEEAFYALQAPIGRVAAPDTPYPLARSRSFTYPMSSACSAAHPRRDGGLSALEFRLPDVGEGMATAEIVAGRSPRATRSASTRTSSRSRPTRRPSSSRARRPAWSRGCAASPGERSTSARCWR